MIYVIHLPCDDCHAERLVSRSGDVAQCTRCTGWWTRGDIGGPRPISPQTAARLALESMPLEDIIAALDAAAAEMEIL